jgi:hypothetical protein
MAKSIEQASEEAIKEGVVRRIQTGIRQLSTALSIGKLADAAGWKNYTEGYVSCAEVALVITHAEAVSFRQLIQRVAKGEVPREFI